MGASFAASPFPRKKRHKKTKMKDKKTKSNELFDKVRRNINPTYVKMLKDFRRGIETNNLFFDPFEISMPHGRGAGATSAIIQTILYGIEKDWENKQREDAKRADPKWQDRYIRTFKPYRVAPTQDRRIVGSALIVCPSECFIPRDIMHQVAYEIEKLGLRDYWSDCLENRSFIRKDYGAVIRIVSDDKMRGLTGCFKYCMFMSADYLDGFLTYRELKDNALGSTQTRANTFSFLDFNVPESETHWIVPIMVRRHNGPTFKKYPATYRTMPREWLGEPFFKVAEMLRKANPTAYKNEYLGKVKTIFHHEPRH